MFAIIETVLAGARKIEQDRKQRRELAGGRSWSPETVYRCQHEKSVVSLNGTRVCLVCRAVWM